MIKEGDKAPDFELAGDDGQIHGLKKYQGKIIVLYFYPKDMTPGCTTESCEFNESLATFQDCNAVVMGISRDSLPSHARFKSKYGLQFPLLSDPDARAHQQFGAFDERPVRTTVVIDTEGRIAKIWHNVRVKGHVEAVAEFVQKMAPNKETPLMSSMVFAR